MDLAPSIQLSCWAPEEKLMKKHTDQVTKLSIMLPLLRSTVALHMRHQTAIGFLGASCDWQPKALY